MHFNRFYEQILKIKNLPLPGTDSHHKMSPPLREAWIQANKSAKMHPKKAGVLALFYPDAAKQTRLLLILRKVYQGVHSNQIGFPGGKWEKYDTNLLETALRETHEEVGVHPKRVEVVKALTELYIPPSNFEVQPYIGVYPNPQPFSIQESEVEALVAVRLQDFLDDANHVEELLSTSYATHIRVPAYKLSGYTVWGATAMMLGEIQELLKQVL